MVSSVLGLVLHFSIPLLVVGNSVYFFFLLLLDDGVLAVLCPAYHIGNFFFLITKPCYKKTSVESVISRDRIRETLSARGHAMTTLASFSFLLFRHLIIIRV